jgi:hypothetical protein
MSREAMQMALEALESDPTSLAWLISKKQAIAALRQALETEQEPVAWRTFDGEGGYDYRSYEMNETYDKEWSERNPNHKGWVEPLYTAPQKKEWVGLTDDDYEELLRTRDWGVYLIEAVEAKLKEKNNERR